MNLITCERQTCSPTCSPVGHADPPPIVCKTQTPKPILRYRAPKRYSLGPGLFQKGRRFFSFSQCWSHPHVLGSTTSTCAETAGSSRTFTSIWIMLHEFIWRHAIAEGSYRWSTRPPARLPVINKTTYLRARKNSTAPLGSVRAGSTGPSFEINGIIVIIRNIRRLVIWCGWEHRPRNKIYLILKIMHDFSIR